MAQSVVIVGLPFQSLRLLEPGRILSTKKVSISVFHRHLNQIPCAVEENGFGLSSHQRFHMTRNYGSLINSGGLLMVVSRRIVS
jgi:hypothetical protein